MWFHLARQTKRNQAALEVTWMQNSDRELLNQHFLFHLGVEKKALGRAEEGNGREWDGRGDKEKYKKNRSRGLEGGRRGGGGNRQEWRVIMSTLARGAKCWNISNWISFWAVGGGGWNLAACPHSSPSFLSYEILSHFQHEYSLVRLQLSYMHVIVGPFTWIYTRLYSKVHDLIHSLPEYYRRAHWSATADQCATADPDIKHSIWKEMQTLTGTSQDSRSKSTYEPLKANPVIYSMSSCSGSLCIMIICAIAWRTSISLESKWCNVVCKEERWASTVYIYLHVKRNTLQSLNVMTSDVFLQNTLRGFQMWCHTL